MKGNKDVWSKEEIRREMKARRKTVPVEMRALASKEACRQLLAHEDVRAALAKKASIAVYLASPDEIDLTGEGWRRKSVRSVSPEFSNG